ncbi:hypothetical protein [Labilibacter marinus]|uniref:hypothetical protein n=1 Tax=Labilibacter marinus TaxID=1477105 RepID=UPI000830C860|nr:hypothetical protein [Labilibacter marinus]
MTNEEIVIKVEECNSKHSALFLGDYIAKNPEHITVLIQLMAEMKQHKHWKAAWILDHVYQENHALIPPYIDDMMAMFSQSSTGSILRITGKLLSFHDITNRVDGNFINRCFDLIISPQTPVAIKVHAMQLAFNISEEYPELKPELKIILQDQLSLGTGGFKSRAKKLIKEL